MGKTVGLAYNLKTDYRFQDGDPKDANAEFDSHYTIDAIEAALKSGGNKVVKIGGAKEIIKSLNKNKLSVDIIFNIAEGFSGRNRESEVPIILEMMGIPFVGSDGLTLGLTLDKVMTKKVLISDGLPTPKFIDIDDVANLNGFKLNYPLIVKPRFEGSSKGLNDNSKVENAQRLKEQADWVIKTYKQPALIEEFISGTEFTVAVVGNKKPYAFPVVQVKIDGKLKLGDLFYTNSRIRSRGLRYVCPAQIKSSFAKELQDIAIKTYKAVECRDFGRVDFRVDKKGKPYILEINPLPSLSMSDVFGVAPKLVGKNYSAIVNEILDHALERYGIVK